MTRVSLIFCHGFGFDETFWHRLMPFFSSYSCFFRDLGYFSPQESNISFIERVSSQHQGSFVGIGHSLGLHHLFSMPLHFSGWFGIDSFTSFLGYEKETIQKRMSLLKAVKYDFYKDQEKALKNFHHHCQAPDFLYDPSQIIKESLIHSLESLRSPMILEGHEPFGFLSQKDDPIVPALILEEQKQRYPHFFYHSFSSHGHALPWTHPEAVSHFIKDFLHFLGCDE